LTLVVLTGAGLLVKSYLRVLAVDPGYDPKNLLTLNVRPDEAKYPPGSPQSRAFYQEVLARVKAIPGVKAVASANVGMPMTGGRCMQLLIVESRAPEPAEQRPQAECSSVGPDYIRAMGMRLRAGRGFTEQDDDKGPPVVIINETLARRYFSGEDPIGKRVPKRCRRSTGRMPRATILGRKSIWRCERRAIRWIGPALCASRSMSLRPGHRSAT
jgi:putative ABC transport system permease protein